jgi:uncharacterized membrane protein
MRAWKICILRVAPINSGEQIGSLVTTYGLWPMPLAKRALVVSLILTALIYGVPLVLNILSVHAAP